MRVGNFFQKTVKIDLFGKLIPRIVNPAKYITGASWVAQWWRIHLPVQATQVWSPGGEDPLEEEMATHAVFLPGKSDGQRSLAGYSP